MWSKWTLPGRLSGQSSGGRGSHVSGEAEQRGSIDLNCSEISRGVFRRCGSRYPPITDLRIGYVVFPSQQPALCGTLSLSGDLPPTTAAGHRISRPKESPCGDTLCNTSSLAFGNGMTAGGSAGLPSKTTRTTGSTSSTACHDPWRVENGHILRSMRPQALGYAGWVVDVHPVRARHDDG
jgi:hypothetical protein